MLTENYTHSNHNSHNKIIIFVITNFNILLFIIKIIYKNYKKIQDIKYKILIKNGATACPASIDYS